MALTIGDNFSYKGAKPLDARLKYDTLATMKAVADSELYDGILAYCVGADKTYQWKSTNTVNEDTGKWREFTSGGGGGQTIQVDTMPSAGADEVGHIYEYTGDTTASFVNGRFYKCVTDGTTYEWAEVLMNDNETQEISKADFDALPQSEKDNGKAYFIPDATAVSNLTVMGNRFDKANIYTEGERMVGSWMGKPLYQKSYDVADFTAGSWKTIDTIAGIEKLIRFKGTIEDTTKGEVYDITSSLTLASRLEQFPIYGKATGEIAVYAKRETDSYGNVRLTVQYTKTTDGEVKIGAPNDYSTDEMIIGTWIDGKPIYQKTFVDDTVRAYNIGWFEVPNSAIENFNELISASGIAVWRDGSGNIIKDAIPENINGTEHQVSMNYLSHLSVYAKTGVNRSWLKFIITIQYTKTTD